MPTAAISIMAPADSVGTKVEQAYRRDDLFETPRELMRGWGEYCTGPAPEGTVVALRRRARDPG
jgi:hypothetical protein